jgi:hypothetical protein
MNTRLMLGMSGAALAGFLLMAAPVSAQTDEVVAHVPFQFMVGDTLMPAGTYLVQALSDDPAVMRVEEQNGPALAMIITNWGAGQATSGAELGFREYGHAKFLTRVVIPGETARSVPLPLSEIQKDLVRLASAH